MRADGRDTVAVGGDEWRIADTDDSIVLSVGWAALALIVDDVLVGIDALTSTAYWIEVGV